MIETTLIIWPHAPPGPYMDPDILQHLLEAIGAVPV